MILRFVDKEYARSGGDSGNILLDVHDSVKYCVDEIEFPTPKPRIEWRDPSHGDGRSNSFHKYENREITLRLNVFGPDDSDLVENAHDLWEQFLADNPILEWIADGHDPLYIDVVSPPLEINSPDWFETWIRENQRIKVLSNVEIVFEAQPFLRGPEESIFILKNLGTNDSFEEVSGDDFEGWTETETDAGTVTDDAANYLDGAHGCKLTTTAGGTDVAGVSDTDYLIVDETKHYGIQVYAKELSGAPNLNVELECYDSDNVLLDTLTPLEDHNPADTNWHEIMYCSGEYIVYPSDSTELIKFPEGTAKVKRNIYNDAAVASAITIDNLWFGCVEYIIGNYPSGAIGINIPPDEISGDVPAFLDMYFTNPFSSGPWIALSAFVEEDLNDIEIIDTSHIYAVGDNGTIVFYDGTTWTEQDSGVEENLNGVSAVDKDHVYAIGDNGTILFRHNEGAWTELTYPALSDKCVDGGMEAWDDVNNLTYWDFSYMGSLSTLERSTDEYSGTYAAKITLGAASPPQTTRAFLYPKVNIPIGAEESYLFSWYSKTDFYIAITARVTIYFYDSDGVHLGTKQSDIYYPDIDYRQRTFLVNPNDIPNNAEQMIFSFDVSQYAGDPHWVEFDEVSIEQVADCDLNAVYALASNNIIAVGSAGETLKSTDGTTWTRKTSGTSRDLYDVFMLDATHIYIVGEDGWVLTSADGDTYTKRRGIDGYPILYGVTAYDATHAYAVGEGGTILFSGNDGVTWSSMSSPTSNDLFSICTHDGSPIWAVGEAGTLIEYVTAWSIYAAGTLANLYSVDCASDTFVMACGAGGVIIRGIVDSAPLITSEVILGQRKKYSSDYNPVLDALGDTQTLLYTRRNQYYRSMLAGEDLTEVFTFSVDAHEGRYLVTVNISWAASTTKDQAEVTYELQTLGGDTITAGTQTDSVDCGDPNTEFIEVALLSDRWEIINLPSYQIGDSAQKKNIIQAVIVSQVEDDDQNEWLDYCAIIPIDIFTQVEDFAGNALIFDSSTGLVLSSLDGSQDTGQVYTRENVKGFGQYLADPDGVNMTLLMLKDVSGDMRANSFCNVEARYMPLYLLL